MAMGHPSELPGDAVHWAEGYVHRTSEVAGVAFRARSAPEDFFVEELPAGEPEGEGPHVWFTVEKRGLSTDEMLRRLGQTLGRNVREFGVAGRKDRVAVTRQRVSIEHAAPGDVRSLEVPGVRVLGAERARKKIRLGQHAGNRFRLVLRDVEPGGRERMEQVVSRLVEVGLPNYFGAQRFGLSGRGHELGRLLAAADPRSFLEAATGPAHAPDTPERAILGRAVLGGGLEPLRTIVGARSIRDPFLSALARALLENGGDLERTVGVLPLRHLRLHLAALQGLVFNRVLAARLRADALDRAEAGDLVHDHHAPPGSRNGKRVQDVESEEELVSGCHSLRLSPTGPLPGARGLADSGRPETWEREALEFAGVSLEQLASLPPRLAPRGDRRPLRVPVRELRIESPPARSVAGSESADALLLEFILPPGSYATVLLEELGKSLM